jgi:GTPase
MNLTRDDWTIALKNLKGAALKVKADCQILLTKNVGGDAEAESINEKEKDCTGKILIRQHPATVEDVIETRIAVVGNVDAGKSTMLGMLLLCCLRTIRTGFVNTRQNLFRNLKPILTSIFVSCSSC